MSKIKSLKSKNFYITYDGETQDSPFTSPWEVHQTYTKEEQKSKGKKYDENIMGTISFSAPDEFKCTEMKINFNKNLTQTEYEQLLFTAGSSVEYFKDITFIRVIKANQSEELLKALEVRKFVEDPTDHKYLVHEKAFQPIFTVYWLLGLSCGMSVGMSLGNMSLGLCFGIAIGMMLGAAIDSSSKTRFGKLKAAREGRKYDPKAEKEAERIAKEKEINKNKKK